MTEVDFAEEGVLAAAREATGLDDFGDESFREPLRMLLRTYDENAYSEKARRRNRRRVLTLLGTRLKIEDAFARHPEIRERRISRPMVLTGLPRSGTSALFNTLACDPATRALLLWEAMNPDPVEGLGPDDPDPRREMIEGYYASLREKNPDFTKIHFASADTPEECVLLHAFSLNGVHLGTEVMLEPYASWYRKQDLRPMYAYYADLLRMLDWQRPGERWLLKAPAHMWAIDALIETFPDVSIVWNHRNPLECTASACSMTAMLMDGREGFDPTELGPVVMDFYATSLERGLAARDRQDPRRFFDVGFGRLVDDPMAVVRDIYAHFGLEMAPAAERAIADHVAANPKGKHGAHEYGLEEYGLTPEAARARFAPYIERFGIEVP